MDIEILKPRDIVQPDVPEDRRYWIYWVSFSWRFKHDVHNQYCKTDEDGFCQNGTASHPAFRAEASIEELKEAAQMAWDGILEREEKKEDNTYHDHELIRATAHLYQRTEWWLTWFCTSTFDNGQTDDEAMASFEDYVSWVERTYTQDPVPGEHAKILLMGAEDRWRWYGEKEGSDPPCRCEGCKVQGLIKINH